MTAFDTRHIHKTRRAPDQRATGKGELRYRLPAAFGKGAGAVANPLAARECATHQRMRFEPLEFFERREIGILVIEVNNKADGDKVVAVVIEKRAAAGVIGKRQAHCVL